MTRYIIICIVLLIVMGSGCISVGPYTNDQGTSNAVEASSVNTTPTSTTKSVEPRNGIINITIITKFDCVHCYNLSKGESQLETRYGDKIHITQVPIVFDKQPLYSIEAYIIADHMGKGKEMRNALYVARFEKNIDIINDVNNVKTVASEIGLGPKFNADIDSGAFSSEASDNLKLVKQYRIYSFPAVLIDGNLNKDITTIDNLNTTIAHMLN